MINGATGVPTQEPSKHASAVVEGPSTSSQTVPSGRFDSTHDPPLLGSQVEVTHWEEGTQSTLLQGLAPRHTAEVHTSLVVSAKVSSQEDSSACGVYSQYPPTHCSVWHERVAHVTPRHRSIPTHVPLWQVSLSVPESPSLQGVSLANEASLHNPSSGSHTAGSWHERLEQTTRRQRLIVGLNVGLIVGVSVVGVAVGVAVGETVGLAVVGEAVGIAVGDMVGFTVVSVAVGVVVRLVLGLNVGANV